MIRALPDAEGILQLEILSGLPGVRHGFATRRGRLEDVVPQPVARLKQVHGAAVLTLPPEPDDRTPFLEAKVDLRPHADALITDRPATTVSERRSSTSAPSPWRPGACTRETCAASDRRNA